MHHRPSRGSTLTRSRSARRALRGPVTAAALVLSATGCDVGSSVLLPRDAAARTDRPSLDVPPADVPPADAPAADAPPADITVDAPVPSGPTCGSALAAALPACGAGSGFVPCLTMFAGSVMTLPPGESSLFSDYTTCMSDSCGPSPSARCIADSCYNEGLACLPSCRFAAPCALACELGDCHGVYDTCGSSLSGDERARFAALRACLERACGASLDFNCVGRNQSMCASERAACGDVLPPTDGGAPTDASVDGG